MQWIQTGGSGSAGQPGPPGPPATPPPGLTTVSSPSITVDVQGNVVLVFDLTFPAILGTMSQIFIRVEMPYAGEPSTGSDINLPPAAVIDDTGPYPLSIVSGVVQNTQAYVTEPAPQESQIWAAWFATGSGDYRNDWADSSTILVTFTVDPVAGLIPGEEWGPNPTGLALTIDREVRKGSEQWWRPNVFWTLPDSDDPRLPAISQWNIGLLNPEISASDPERQIVTLTSLPPSTTSWSGSFARVSDHDIRYIVMVRPQNAQGEQNSYVPGVTAALPVTIGPQTIVLGEEQANVVTGLTASGAWGKDTQGNRQFEISVSWDNPDDPRFGGVVLNLVSVDPYDAAPGQPITGIETGTSRLLILAGRNGPRIAGTWHIVAISVDANGAPNTYVSGVTPIADFAVDSWFTGAPTLQASGLVVAAGGSGGSFYTDYDFNGIPELTLLVTFTPPDPAIDPSWAYVDFWAQRPDDGLWYNYISINKSGTAFSIGQLPKATGTWHFLLIDYDVNGKNLLGDSTGNPLSPPTGSATFSLSIPPPSLGVPGIEYASLVTTPTVTIGSPVAQPDGTYKELVHLTAVIPSDSRFGGFKVIVKYTSGALNGKFEEITDIASPQTSADIIWTPPAGSVTSTWYYVSYNKLGQLNTIVGGTTPGVSQTVGTTSQLDFSAAKLATINQNLIRINPATGLFENWNADQAIFGVLQIGGGNFNGKCNTANSGANTIITGTLDHTGAPAPGADPFLSAWVGKTLYVATATSGGTVTPVVILSFTNSTHLVVQGNLGTLTGVNWSFGMTPQFKIFDRLGNQIGFWGDDSFNTGFVGMFAGRDVRLGGTIGSPIFEVDSGGAVTIQNALFILQNVIGLTTLTITLDPGTGVLESKAIGAFSGSKISVNGSAIQLDTLDTFGVVDLDGSSTRTETGLTSIVNAVSTSLGFSETLRITGFTGSSPYGPILSFLQERGTPTSPGHTASGDTLGGFIAAGYDGVGENYCAGVRIVATENHSGVANHGTKVVIEATPDGSSVPVSSIEVSAGGVSRYVDKATAGMGVPPIYASASFSSRTGSISTVNLDVGGATAPAGLYRIAFYANCTVAGSAGSLTLNIHFNDGTASRTVPYSLTLTSTTLLTSMLFDSLPVRSNGSAHITFDAVVSGASGSPQYALDISLERLA